jgi:hypothetical protein
VAARKRKAPVKKSSAAFGGKKAPPFGSAAWQAKYGKKRGGKKK